MIVVGIDPGLSGAIAILENNKVLNIFDMPVMAEGKKNKRQLNILSPASISKNFKKYISFLGRKVIFSDIQYVHLKSHLSVTDTLK